MKVELRVFEPLNQQSLTFDVEEGIKIEEVLLKAVREGLLNPRVVQEPHWVMIGN